VDENRPDAPAVRRLADAHARREAEVAVVAISASEKQKHGLALANFGQFRERLNGLKLGHLEVLKPMMYFDVTYWDWAYWVEPEMDQLERQIHDVLFPKLERQWADFCRARSLDPNTLPRGTEWHNAKCDVQALWSHVYHHRNVFVTRDVNFHKATKKPALLSLGAGRIEEPGTAIALLTENGV
jgi:hypothetical protein